MKKILFLITTLNGGGAEKILIDTVNTLDKEKYQIEIKTVINRGKYIKSIPEHVKYSYIFDDIKVKNLFLKKIYFSFLLRVLKILPAKLQYKFFIRDKYDTEVAFLEGTPTKLISGSSNCKSKKLSWVHVNPKILPYSRKAYLNVSYEKKAYEKFDYICCVSQEVKNDLDKLFNTTSKSIVQLNVLDEMTVKTKSTERIDEFRFENENINIISIGRLAPQKNYQLLLKVANKLIKEGKVFNLYILGDGDERDVLEEYIYKNKLEKEIKLLGFKNNPYPYIKKSDMFVCSSITEGFSTVVSESIVLGVPVITTDCAGMRDIFGDSECGLIVENSFDGLYNGLSEILSNKNTIQILRRNTKKRQSFFCKEKRISELENIL